MLLGIDIGGTTINFGLVKGNEIRSKHSVPSFPAGATCEETLSYLSGNISRILTPEVKRIGIGVPTLVDTVRGIVYNAANIESWKEVHLKDHIEGQFGIPVSVNNDANSFALGAAAKVGCIEGIVVGITLGTGLGIGIVMDGKLMSGANCGAGELCSVPYNGKDYEEFCSKKFFEARGRGSRETVAAAEKGDPEALAFFDEFGRHLGNLLTLVMYAYDPAHIVFGGGIAYTAPCFKESMMRTLRGNYQYQHALDNLKIHFMPGEDMALLGASLL